MENRELAARVQEKGMYWGEIPEAEMTGFVELASEKGYKHALADVSCKYPDFTSYVTSAIRSDWVFHCYSTESHSHCLDLGSGWGGLSFSLTGLFDETVSVERVLPRLCFQKIRAGEENTFNLSLAQADMLSLPFKDGSFDLGVANGVLEWVAVMRENSPRNVQVQFLQEILRCLKPGGCLFIGSENRFGLQYWLGNRDHTSLRFTSLLPRRISDLIVSRLLRDHGWKRYYTYTHSYGGYDSLLKAAGFGPVRIYWTYPTYNYPKFAGSIDDDEGFRFLFQYNLSHYEMNYLKRIACVIGQHTPNRILRRICAMFWPSYLIFAWKEHRPSTMEAELARVMGAESIVRLSGRDAPCANVSFIALEHGPTRYAKLSRCPGNMRLENEEQLLSTYANLVPSKDQIGKFQVYTHKAIDGKLCSPRSIRDCELTIDWLLKFQERTALTPLSHADAKAEQSEMSLQLSKLGIGSNCRYALEKTNDLMTDLTTSGMTKCSEHGDFWPDNILIRNGSELAVFDWEFFRPSGNPLFDAGFFVIALASTPTINAFVANMSGSGAYSQVIERTVKMYSSRKRLSARTVLLGIPYVVLRCIIRHSIYGDTPSPVRVQQFRKLLEMITQAENSLTELFPWNAPATTVYSEDKSGAEG